MGSSSTSTKTTSITAPHSEKGLFSRYFSSLSIYPFHSIPSFTPSYTLGLGWHIYEYDECASRWLQAYRYHFVSIHMCFFLLFCVMMMIMMILLSTCSRPSRRFKGIQEQWHVAGRWWGYYRWQAVRGKISIRHFLTIQFAHSILMSLTNKQLWITTIIDWFIPNRDNSIFMKEMIDVLRGRANT